MTVADQPVRTLAVRCAEWPAVATGRPADVPVAVVFANRVRSVSPAARAEDVWIGLRRREAQARCPSLEIWELDESRDARAFEAVLVTLSDIAPRLEVTEAGRCAVPTRGPSRYHGGDRALAELVLERVTRALPVETPVGIGIADGPLAAALAAEEAIERHQGRPVVVPPGGAAQFLAPLPVTCLTRVGLIPGAAASGSASGTGSGSTTSELVDVLRRLGIRTLGRLAALSVPDVAARFDQIGLAAHRLASGREERPPHVTEPPPDLRVSAALDPPAERVDQAAFMAKALADSLHDELAGRGLACTRVLVAAETEVGDRIERLWRHEGSLSASAIAQRVRWQLDGWLSSGRSLARTHGGVSRIELIPDEVVPDSGRQLGFWGGGSRSGERALRALARVQALVGVEAVVVPEWQGGRSPADQYRLVPIDAVDLGARDERGVSQGGEATPGESAPWPGALPSPSPAVVWPRPVVADVVDADGRRVGVGGRGLISSPPARVSVDGGSWIDVVSWAGPWCVEERWWDPIAHRRRARLQVVMADGSGSGQSAQLLALSPAPGGWRPPMTEWLEATCD